MVFFHIRKKQTNIAALVCFLISCSHWSVGHLTAFVFYRQVWSSAFSDFRAFELMHTQVRQMCISQNCLTASAVVFSFLLTLFRCSSVMVSLSGVLCYVCVFSEFLKCPNSPWINNPLCEAGGEGFPSCELQCVPQAERCRLVEQVNGRLKNALLKINCARETGEPETVEERETSNGDV